ncbi:hypothetical protein GGS23DRAFT_560056 [Durotheca rogersii]|uniref:uncharacterized protein n=1 Tax=Durotheca rogersii TaxID=419775 RepID=UPI0022206425|nr:uncharacterized protein GGS23DRAFT_560056 [Durotheca rogersii]KAI5865623.1 hypothetical protein GGS23DRAFT_560056 [Durotheca rogersii]
MWKNLTYLQSHADHCRDFLRQSVMCYLDFTTYILCRGERVKDGPTRREPGIQKRWARELDITYQPCL